MTDPAPTPAVTRDQVHEALDRTYVDHPPDTTGVFDAMTDAVMALLAEAPQPKVLLKGRLTAFDSGVEGGGMLLHVYGEWVHSDKRLSLGRDGGTRVAVVALGPPVPEAPEGGSDA